MATIIIMVTLVIEAVLLVIRILHRGAHGNR
jgi:hypothetical protein